MVPLLWFSCLPFVFSFEWETHDAHASQASFFWFAWEKGGSCSSMVNPFALLVFLCLRYVFFAVYINWKMLHCRDQEEVWSTILLPWNFTSWRTCHFNKHRSTPLCPSTPSKCMLTQGQVPTTPVPYGDHCFVQFSLHCSLYSSKLSFYSLYFVCYRLRDI